MRLPLSAMLVAALLAAVASGQEQKGAGSVKPGYSQYVTMPDGVDIALTVFFPMRGTGIAKRPTIVEFTRYGRLTVETPAALDAWQQAGFNVVLVDTRGSGASFGSRFAEVSPNERNDIGVVLDWIAKQDWSNSRVVVTGLSYNADTAEMATATQASGLAGALIRHSEFNVYKHIVFPGGVAAKVGIELWGQYTHALDTAEDCLKDAAKCVGNPALAPVDADVDLSRIVAAIAEHQQNSRADVDFAAITFTDDRFPSGVSVDSIGASAVKEEIKNGAVPSQVWASWLDAGTAESALERFNSFPETATEVYIAAWTHGGRLPADPFFEDGPNVVMSTEEQFAVQLGFMKRAASGGPMRRVIHYVPLNSVTWKETVDWPPRSLTVETRYLSRSHGLARVSGPHVTIESQRVDFTSTTGSENRWRGNFFSAPINYGDRSRADQALLYYETEPLSRSLELIGTVVARLSVVVDRTDAAIFVYLEDVAPNGKATYLTEGELRLVHRKASPSCGRTYRRADALPVIPGRPMSASICLLPIAAHLESRHRLRVVIAGADADTFARYPDSGPLTMGIQLGGKEASAVDIPTRPWQ